MSNFYTPSVAINLTLNLEDGAIGLFPQATLFSNGTLEDTVNLAHVGSGRYSGVWTPGAIIKTYDALFIVYTDAGHTVESTVYTRAMEKWQSDTLIAAATSDTNTRTRLIEKLLRNRLELADGSTSNWILYDDDSVTPLLTFNVKDKTGAGIVQQALVPSRRSRGV